ncbi:hypothetical protein QTP86_022711 [Hemibagrus guttatus]|nr:hypothetical protein QTP86_022711 [Hemibagrus guttatus]
MGGADRIVQSEYHFLIKRSQSEHARYARHNQGRLRTRTQASLYFDSFSSEEASRSGALSLSLAFPSTLAVSLGLPHSKPFNQKPLQHGTMSKKKKEWRAEKERLLSHGQEERRKEYGDNYVALDKIPTWRYHHSREPEEEEENPVSLCDKVSLYKGDITILEVDAIVNADYRKHLKNHF